MSALRAEGFAVTASTRSDICGDAKSAYAISNDPGAANPDEYNRVQHAHGIAYCVLYRVPVFRDKLESDLHERAFSPIFSGRKAHFWLRNLECRLYADDKRGNEQVLRLARAMRRLAATSTH